MFFRFSVVAFAVFLIATGSAQAQVRSLMQLPDSRQDFVRLCAPHIQGRGRILRQSADACTIKPLRPLGIPTWREALLRGIGETGVPTIETEWVPPSKRSEIGATFTKIAKPALAVHVRAVELGPLFPDRHSAAEPPAKSVACCSILSSDPGAECTSAREQSRPNSSWCRRLP